MRSSVINRTNQTHRTVGSVSGAQGDYEGSLTERSQKAANCYVLCSYFFFAAPPSRASSMGVSASPVSSLIER